MRIAQETIENVKQRVDIVDVIGDFVQLKKAGQNYKALSPFTDEKTPSFFVSPSKEIFKCFSTGKGGDAISFIMELDGLNYTEAIRYLAQKYGVEIIEEGQTDESILQQNERESLFIILQYASRFFRETLMEHEEGKAIGLSYFKERGFTIPIIEKFELGYSLDSWDALSKKALKEGFSEELLTKAGLMIENGERRYDRFRGRITFPIHNLTGKVIAFGARTLKKDKKQPKYINSPETEVYHKSNVLYGISQAKKAIRKEENCYLVEGYTDVISLHQSNIENVVASSGTSLTEEQIRVVSRFTDTLTVLFDGDKAGLKAALRGVDMILEGGLNVRVVLFPEGEDPDSYSRKLGTTAFQEYLKENSQDFINFKADLYAKETVDDPIKKADTIKEIIGSISKIPDPIKRAIYVKETAVLLDIDESILISEQNKLLLRRQKEQDRKRQKEQTKSEAGKEHSQGPSAPDDMDSLPPEVLAELYGAVPEEPQNLKKDIVGDQEREQVRLLVNYGYYQMGEEATFYNYLLEELEEITFQVPIYQRILEVIRTKLAQDEVVDGSYLVQHGDEEVKKVIVDLISEQSRYELSEEWQNKHDIVVQREADMLETAAFKSLLRYKLVVVQQRLQDLAEQLKEAKEIEQQDQLLMMHMEYKKIESEIAKPLGRVISR